MIYKFKSKATGDTIMLGPNGDQLLRLLGREPAPKGIVEVADMPAALTALQAAIDDDDRVRRERGGADDEAGTAGREPVTLRTRMWPMVEMLRRAHAGGEPVVWGV